MKLPPFKLEEMRWDRFHQFYQTLNHPSSRWMSSGFIMFMSGELICTASRRDGKERLTYSDLNVRLVNTDDLVHPPKLFTLDQQPITKAWLNDGGSQTLLIDLDTHRAVRLSTYLRASDADIPVWLDNECSAYCPGPSKNFVGSPVEVSRPHKWDHAEWAHVDHLRVASQAWAAMEQTPSDVAPRSRDRRRKWRTETWPYPWKELLSVPSFEGLSAETRRQIATYGVEVRRDITQYPCLVTENYFVSKPDKPLETEESENY